MAVFNRQSMKRVRWIKGPTKRDGSRFAVLTEPIGSGSRNPGDRGWYLQCKTGTTGRDGRAYASFSIAGLALLVRATTHGYVRLFRYADDPPGERAREQNGREEDRTGRLTFALFSRRYVCVCVLKRVFAALFAPRAGETPPPFPTEKTPPRYARRGGSSLLATVRNLHVDALFDARLRIGWS